MFRRRIRDSSIIMETKSHGL